MDSQDKTHDPAPRPQPTSAPKVPKELLSARPAMTRVVPRSPEKMAQLDQEQPADKPELTPEELAERQDRIEYLKNLRQKETKPRKSSGKKWLIALIVLLLVAAAGGAIYWFLFRPTTAPTPATTSQSAQKQSSSATQAPATTDATKNLKDYQSTNFNVSFKYPSDWAVSDTAQKLTLTSAQTSLAGANGSKTNGQVIMTIRPKQTALDEFKAGNATAVLDSKKVSYSQPAPGQRDSTYLSYLQYAKTTTKGALDAVYVTGNAGYQKGQAVPQADVVKVDPLITVSFVSCSATCSTTAPAMNVSASDWVASDSGKTIETVLKSLSIN